MSSTPSTPPLQKQGTSADSLPDSLTGAPTLPGETATTAPAPHDIPQPPGHRLPPVLKKGVRQVFFDFNHAPRDIIHLMDEMKQREQAFQSQRGWRQLVAWLCFPAGLFFLVLDVALGYNVCTFTLVAIALWIAGIVALLWLRWQRTAQFDSRYDLTRQMFDVLKDDVAGERTLMGWLDLTGAQQESKIIRQASSASGQPIMHYLDEWLRMKARLYDGSVLRASLFERVKARQGYHRRGSISGKMKWRAGSVQDVHRLRIAVSTNPDLYTIQPVTHQGAIPNSRFVLEEAEVAGGQLRLGAATLDHFDAWDVLNVMRFAYDHLQARQAA